MTPRTVAKRDAIRRRYCNHDRHWIWTFICREYHNETGDPESKSEMFLKVSYIIHCLLNQNNLDLVVLNEIWTERERK